jgi:hypothetical protein
MGEPAPPAPPADPPAPPPAPAPAGPGNGPPAEPDLAANVARLEAALAEERKRAAAAEGQLTKLRNQNMSEHEKAVAAAKAEGRTEAVREAGLKLAAAEFRAAATGKLADPAAALDVIDLSKYVSEDGEVDSKALAVLVDKLAAALPAPAGSPARVPAGPHGDTGEPDFIRQALGQR